MIAVAAPVGLCCILWLALISRWVDTKSLRAACVFLLLLEITLTAVSLASVSSSGCSAVFTLVSS